MQERMETVVKRGNRGGGGETAWREKDDLPDLDQLSFSPGALKKTQKNQRDTAAPPWSSEMTVHTDTAHTNEKKKGFSLPTLHMKVHIQEEVCIVGDMFCVFNTVLKSQLYKSRIRLTLTTQEE